MQHHKTLAQIAATLLMAGLLVGCGKAAPVQQAPVIDSVFTRLPNAEAPRVVAKQQQDREDAEADAPETTKVGAPSAND